MARYWVGVEDGVWSNTGNWSTSSGGAGGASVPTASDDVEFDFFSWGSGGANKTATLDEDAVCRDLTISKGNSCELDLNGYDLTCRSIIDSAATTFTLRADKETTITIDDVASPPSKVIDVVNLVTIFTKATFKILQTNDTTIDFGGDYVHALTIDGGDGITEHDIQDDCEIGTLSCLDAKLLLSDDKRIGKLIMGTNATLKLTPDKDYRIYDFERATTTGQASIVSDTSSTKVFVLTVAGSYTLDRIAITDIEFGGDGIFYLTEDAGASSITRTAGSIFVGAKATVKQKTQAMRVYDATGSSLLAEYTDKIMQPIMPFGELGFVASEAEVMLKIKASDIDTSVILFNNFVRILIFDNEAPNGEIIFTGYIDSYTVDHDEENISVMVRSHGAKLKDLIVYGASSIVASNYVFDSELRLDPEDDPGIPTFACVDTFTTAGGTTQLDAIKLRVYMYTVAVMQLSVHTSLADAKAGTNALGTVTGQRGAFWAHIETFTFGEAIPVSGSTAYWLRITNTGGPTPPSAIDGPVFLSYDDSSGSLESYDGTTWTSETGTLYYDIYENSLNTSVTYAQELATTLKDIISQSANENSIIDYSPLSLQITGITDSYTFNTNTMLEAIKKIYDMAEEDWQWYIDPATNLLHFKEAPIIEDHTFTKGTSLISLVADKRSNEIYSDILFVGGDPGGGILYKRYTNNTTHENYGRRYLRYYDGRVTVEATADQIADTLLEKHGIPELRVKITVQDNTNNSGGYDIESIKLGDGVRLLNVGETNYSLWDIGIFDASYWDFNINQLSTIVFRISYIEYRLDEARIWLNVSPKSVSDIVGNTSNEFETDRYLDNPTAPT